MERARRPEQAKNAPAPSATRAAPPSAAQAQARPASPQAQHKPAVAPPPKAAAPPPRVEPAGQTAPIEHLTIAPQPSQGDTPSIEFDWEPAALGTNRSYSCTVTTDSGQGLSVSLEQGMYRRSFTGQGAVRIPVVPPAPAATKGTLTATNLATGTSAAFTWQWQPRSAEGAGSAAPPKPAGLIGRLFGRAKQSTAVAAKTQPKPKAATVAERLGARAPLAVALKFFGQAAVGQRFAFILDRSGSMSGARWKACTTQLEQALRRLPERVEFFMVLFSRYDVEPSGQTGWTPAERGRVENVIKWIGGITPGGGTYPATAFERVFSLPSPPDVIYFLTDGELSGFEPSMCASLRGSAPTIVNTIALENGVSADALRETAEASGGQFILVPDAAAAGANG
jgi:hypothetical protein